MVQWVVFKSNAGDFDAEASISIDVFEIQWEGKQLHIARMYGWTVEKVIMNWIFIIMSVCQLATYIFHIMGYTHASYV